MIRITRKYCHRCKSREKCTSAGPLHWLHFLLSLLTWGLWIPIWIVAAIGANGIWNCEPCGFRIRKHTRKERKALAARAAA